METDALRTLNNRGTALQAEGRLAEAEACYRRILEEDPRFVEALFNLGGVLRQRGSLDEARSCFGQVLQLHGEHPDVLTELARIELGLGRHVEALRSASRAAALAPAEAEFAVAVANDVYNAGYALQTAGDYEGAVRIYEEILRTLPTHAEAALGRAICLLGMGDFARGWEAYEIRYDPRLREPAATEPSLPIAKWRGEPLRGKRILLIGEQGAGDQIQFIRYARLLAEQGAAVELLTDRRLRRLLASAEGIEAVHEVLLADSVDYDYWSLLLSLPCLTRRFTDVPASFPYLHPPREAVERARRCLAAAPRGSLKVGFVWSSANTGAEAIRRRNVPPERLSPLAGLEGLWPVGLQFGESGPAVRPGMLHLGTMLGDFADNAAIVAEMDVVVTIDTAAAHLAGALGVTTLLMLSTQSDWRWMRGRADSPWYPSVKIFRQRVPGNWDEVMKAVSAELVDLRRRAC